MSQFSGKCDLCDAIGGLGGWYDRNGKPVKIGDPGVRAYYSDEMKDFLAFKKKTGGVMYQHMKIVVTEFNQNLVAKKCKEFKINEHTRIVPDARKKSKQREEKYYTYEYWGKEYENLKSLNKRHVYITKEIHFDTLLDIIPYYPYVVSMQACWDNKMTVFIADRSYVDEEEESAYKNGWERSLTDYYRKKLQEHYREVVLTYFNPVGREHVETVDFDPKTLTGKLKFNVDTNFSVMWFFDGERKTHYTSPKLVGENVISISKEDFEHYLGSSVEVYYVSAYEEGKEPFKLG